MYNRFACHQINDSECFDFLPLEYSRFKFGDGLVAKKYGVELAKMFVSKLVRLEYDGGQLVIISSPFSFIPTATFAMKNYFVYELNHWLASNGFPVVQETKIYRSITYKEDYGELNAEERIKLIETDNFHIDNEFVKDKTLVFLDDIIITGGHENMILKMISKYDLKNKFYFLYYAELKNKNIHPRIENHLNYSYVKSIFDLDNIINSLSFEINTRIVKFILISDLTSIDIFLKNKDPQFIELLYNLAIGNNYHIIAEYIPAIKLLKNKIKISI